MEKQQAELRIPKYLVDDIEEFIKNLSVNRTDIVIEAIIFQTAGHDKILNLFSYNPGMNLSARSLAFHVSFEYY